MALTLPPVPATLKAIQHYLKTATEHEARDPVVAYWCRLFALQTALKIDKKTDEAKHVLVKLMDWLEVQKKEMADNDAITNDIAAQAHIENYAITLFQWADKQDRAGIFNKNVVKAFYTAGMLMDVLTAFGDLDEEIAANCKYAKWKAAYIHNCLKNGETPIPGPATDAEETPESEASGAVSGSDAQSDLPPSSLEFANSHLPQTQQQLPYEPSNDNFVPFVKPLSSNVIPASPNAFSPFAAPATPTPLSPSSSTVNGVSSNVKLDATQIAKAQKYCKFAGSALNYDDVTEAISCLQKALRLLQTGEDN